MTEAYYTPSVDGIGIEGVLNYTNNLVGGFMSIAFLSAIWIIMIYVLSKSEWKLSSIVSYSTFTVLILSWITKLFMVVSEKFIFALALILALSIVWSILEANKR